MADWRNQLKQKIVRKRTNQNEKAKASAKVLKVQRLSADVGGAWQKYSRVGPLCAVRVDNVNDLELNSFLTECKKAFQIHDHDVELLCSDRGPPAQSLTEINIDKIIHVRFFKTKHTAYSHHSNMV